MLYLIIIDYLFSESLKFGENFHISIPKSIKSSISASLIFHRWHHMKFLLLKLQYIMKLLQHITITYRSFTKWPNDRQSPFCLTKRKIGPTRSRIRFHFHFKNSVFKFFIFATSVLALFFHSPYQSLTDVLSPIGPIASH